MFPVNGPKRRRTTSSMSDSEDTPLQASVPLEENVEHGLKVLRGLNFLKKEKVLCDVSLIAEGNSFNQSFYLQGFIKPSYHRYFNRQLFRQVK